MLVKKIVLAKLWLYRYRFWIGFSVLGLVFAGLIFFMPLVTPGGLSRTEMESAVASDRAGMSSVLEGDVVELPFRLLQKLSITIFGLTSYSVKLPAIIIGFFTGILLILLLNRWFSTNVALIASAFVAMSAFFLSEAGTGSPGIMMIFWTVLILWLGAKIVGEKKVNFALVVALFASLALACYSPLAIYLVVLIALVAIFQPHLRFFLKNCKKWQVILVLGLFVTLVAPLFYGMIRNGDTLGMIATGSGGDYFANVESAFAPFFSFSSASVGGVLAPLFGMATVALVVIGLIAMVGRMNTSRSLVSASVVIFAIVASGLYPDMSMVMFVPILLLVASGIEFVIGRWYELFPENPYARFFGIFPIAIFVGIAMISGMTYYFFGYRYVPAVANEFNDDIDIIRENMPTGGVLIVPGDETRLAFYKILEKKESITVSAEMPDRVGEIVATLGKWEGDVGMSLAQIITSPKATDSDRLYIYRKE